MRSTKKIMSLLAALLLVVLPAISVAGSTTTASVAFEAGGLSWGELDGSGLDNMNLNFGTRYLPT